MRNTSKVPTTYQTEDLDAPEAQVSLETVKARAVKGIAVLTGRGFLLNAIAQVSQIFLLAFLSPEQMGVFWIVSAAVSILIYFSDVGLAAALIQKKERLTQEDLSTTFTIQIALILVLLVVLFVASPFLMNVYGLTADGQMLMYALGVSLFLSSLKSIPSVLLERELKFAKFVIPELLESVFYNVAVVYFAWKGMGITSFTYAVLIRGVVGVVAMYWLSPWKPQIGINRKALHGLLRFGVPYQVNNIISLFKDQGMTLVLGAIIGQAGIGYIGTAKRLSEIPLRLFMDSVTRVSFPAFSRMQEHKEDLARSVTRSILFITFLVFPITLGFLVLAPVLMEVFPKYVRWSPALVPLFFLTINTLFASFTTQLTNMLTAIGKIKTVSKLIVMWSVATILIVPLLAYVYGVDGAAAGYAVVGLFSVVAIYVAKKSVNFSLTIGVSKTLASAFIMAGTLVMMRIFLPHTISTLIAMIIAGSAAYGFAAVLFVGPTLLADAKRIITNVFRK